MSADPRPQNCRFRLKDEGKAYPRSACSGCHKTIFTGLGLGCTVTEPLMRDNFADDEELSPAPVVIDWQARENQIVNIAAGLFPGGFDRNVALIRTAILAAAKEPRHE